MFRLNDIIDLPIIQNISEYKRCTIRDVIIDMRESRVYALVCRERVLRRSLELIPFCNVASISQNGVVVSGRSCQVRLRDLRTRSRHYQSYRSILGKMVLSSRGETTGIIRDLLIDTDSGVIKAYELSEGYIDDIIRGRHIVELECGHGLSGKSLVLKDIDAKWQFVSK